MCVLSPYMDRKSFRALSVRSVGNQTCWSPRRRRRLPMSRPPEPLGFWATRGVYAFTGANRGFRGAVANAEPGSGYISLSGWKESSRLERIRSSGRK